MRIYLLGFMGSGKTTLGKSLSRRLGFSFIDTDREVEKQEKIKVRDIFERKGESHFRELERQVLHSTAILNNTVISTGGGTPCFFDNMEFIKKNGVSIYIIMKPEALVGRLINSKNPRPLVYGLGPDQLSLLVKKELEKREKFYNTADFTIKAELVSIDQIISFLKWK